MCARLLTVLQMIGGLAMHLPFLATLSRLQDFSRLKPETHFPYPTLGLPPSGLPNVFSAPSASALVGDGTRHASNAGSRKPGTARRHRPRPAATYMPAPNRVPSKACRRPQRKCLRSKGNSIHSISPDSLAVPRHLVVQTDKRGEASVLYVVAAPRGDYESQRSLPPEANVSAQLRS